MNGEFYDPRYWPGRHPRLATLGLLSIVVVPPAGLGYGGYELGTTADAIATANQAKIAARHGRCLSLVRKNLGSGGGTALLRLSSLSETQKEDCDLVGNPDYAYYGDGVPDPIMVSDLGSKLTLASGNYGSDYSLTGKIVEVIPGKIVEFSTPSDKAQQDAIKNNRPLQMVAIREAKDTVIQMPTESELEDAINEDRKPVQFFTDGSSGFPETTLGSLVGLFLGGASLTGGVLLEIGRRAKSNTVRRNARPA